jgi:hypothetical protein
MQPINKRKHMKLRSCFVSNSSSCSFTISKSAPEELLFFIYNHEEIIKLLTKLYRKIISLNDVEDEFKPICQKFIAKYIEFNGLELFGDSCYSVFNDLDYQDSCDNLFEYIDPKNDYQCMLYDGWHVEDKDLYISVSTGQDNLDLPRFLNILGYEIDGTPEY